MRSTRPDSQGPGIVASLRRHALLVVLTAVLVGAIAAALISRRDPQYEATAQVLFAAGGPELEVLGSAVPAPADQGRQAATNLVTVQSRVNAQPASTRLGGDPRARELVKAVTVTAAKDSNVVDVAATGPARGEAVRRANAWAVTAVERAQAEQARRVSAAARAARASYAALSKRERRGPVGARLRDQVFRLGALEQLGSASPRLLQPAQADVSRTDNPRQLIVLAVLFGLLVGGGLALLRARSDRRVRDGEDLADAMDVPVLASVGRSKAIRRNTGFGALPETDAEVFRFIYGKLRFSDSSPVSVVLVTSARDGEGKTAVATNLAAAAAASGARALLLEADVRRAPLHQRLGIPSEPGLAQVLRGEAAFEDAVASIDASRGPDGSDPRVLDVLPAGLASPSAAPLLQAPSMRDVLEHTRALYDLVVIDTPPLGLVADALPLLARVDGVLIATFVGRSSAVDVRRLRWQVAEMGGRVLGVVVSKGKPGAGYGYEPSGREAGPVPG